jgi:hypothetical protein
MSFIEWNMSWMYVISFYIVLVLVLVVSVSMFLLAVPHSLLKLVYGWKEEKNKIPKIAPS